MCVCHIVWSNKTWEKLKFLSLSYYLNNVFFFCLILFWSMKRRFPMGRCQTINEIVQKFVQKNVMWNNIPSTFGGFLLVFLTSLVNIPRLSNVPYLAVYVARFEINLANWIVARQKLLLAVSSGLGWIHLYFISLSPQFPQLDFAWF